MAICKTCQGEYQRRECLCPRCFQPLRRGETLCHQCGADTQGLRLCPRCKSDVSAWERENFSLAQFMFRWGALAIVPSVGVLVAWAIFWLPQGETLHSPGMALAAAISSQLVLILLYVQRLFWRERRWAAQVYQTRAASLPLTIGSTFLVGGMCGIIAFVVYKVAGEPDTWTWHKPVFGLFYILAFPWFTATLTLLAIQDYLDRLDQRVPQPLFVHTHRLLRVVVETAIKNLRVLDNGEGDVNRQRERFDVLEVLRIPECGGLQVLLNEVRPEKSPGDTEQIMWRETTWHIQSDRWGRLQALQPHNGTSSQVKRWELQAHRHTSM